MCTGRRDFGEFTGDLSVLGIPYDDLTAADFRKIGYMRQFESYPKSLTVRDYLRATARQLGLKKRRCDERVAECVAAVGMSSFLDVPCGGLSGGQKRRVGVARLLLDAPKVLFLDEPTSGLDATSSLEVISSLKKLVKDGYCIVVTIHQPRMELFKLFTDVLVLVSGQVALHCLPPFTPQDCYEVLCKRLMIPRKKVVYNPADALVDMLENINGWAKLRMWFWHHSQRRASLAARFSSAVEQNTQQGTSKDLQHTETKKFMSFGDAGDRKLRFFEEVESLYPTFRGNAPVKVDAIRNACVLLAAYYFGSRYMFGVCALPYVIGFNVTGFIMQNTVIGVVCTNFATSLSDHDTLLKEKIIGAVRFMCFHTVVYAGFVFAFNLFLFALWAPWLCTAGIPFTWALAQLAVVTLQGLIFAALTVSAMLTIPDTSNAPAVISKISALNIFMGTLMALNGLSIPHQLWHKEPGLLWTSFSFPNSIGIVQNVLEGQKIGCDTYCAEHNANFFVKTLEMTKARPSIHWSPCDRVRVVHAVP